MENSLNNFKAISNSSIALLFLIPHAIRKYIFVNISGFFKEFMGAGQSGAPGLHVQSAVPGEPGHGRDHVQILHHNMVEMAVEEMLRKIVIVTPILVQVSNQK